jgi:hypothetical protein
MYTLIPGSLDPRASRELMHSALPWAPVIEERPAPHRRSAAQLLRVFASRTSRVADRLDPKCA